MDIVLNSGLGLRASITKRAFDLFFSFVGLSLTWWIIVIAWIISAIETKSNGFFIQDRIGRYGRTFKVVKIRTMSTNGTTTTVTTAADPRITRSGRFFRKTKIDELPQLFNVLIGDMSFVGPRPDVPGFADQLVDDDRIILSIRPGITGPATLKYRNEEELLKEQSNPEKYNREVIFPDKVEINKKYVYEYSFFDDLRYIYKTVFG